MQYADSTPPNGCSAYRGKLPAVDGQQPGIDVDLGLDATGNETHSYRVVQQRHARLNRQLFGSEGIFSSVEELSEVLDVESDNLDGFVREIGGKAYELLRVFIPDLMPRWEWDGYASETAADAEQYDEDADRSPSIPQITSALNAAIQVNGLGWLTKIKELIDPKVLRNAVNLRLSRMALGAPEPASPSDSSQSLQPGSGGSDPTSSGTNGQTPPTLEPSASPSPDSPNL